MDEKKILGDNLKRYRQFKNLNQDELGQLVGLKKDTVSRIERGLENVGIDYLVKICKVLNVTLEELFMRNGDLLSLRFVISEHNIKTLKELITIIYDLIEKKNKT